MDLDVLIGAGTALLSAVAMAITGSRVVAKTEQAVAVNDALQAERHQTTTKSIKELASLVKEQNGRVGKLEIWKAGVEAVQRERDRVEE